MDCDRLKKGRGLKGDRFLGGEGKSGDLFLEIQEGDRFLKLGGIEGRSLFRMRREGAIAFWGGEKCDRC